MPIRAGRRRGRGFMSFLKKAHGYLGKSKIISRVAGALNKAGVPHAGKVAALAGRVGYGRRYRRVRRRRR